MAYDFPNSPTIGDTYEHYTWDGEKWNTTGTGGSTPDTTAPTITSSGTFSVNENTAFSTTLTANETVTWAKVGGADAGAFTLNTSTGVLGLLAKDYETQAHSWVVQVQATDAASNASTIQTITVTILDVSEGGADVTPPVITSASAFIAIEGSPYPHTLTATDAPDDSFPITWTKIGGADAAQFTILGNTLTLAAQDYDLGTSRVVQVRATDTASNYADQTITATILEIVEGAFDLTWTSDYTAYNPVFTLTDYTAAVGDILTLEVDDNSDFSSLYDSEPNTLDAGEVAAGTITYSGITTLLPGVTYYARVKLERGADPVTYTNTVSKTMYIDVIAPTVVSYSPLDNATTVAPSVDLIVTFSEAVVLGATGTVALKKTSDNSTVDSWDVATDSGSGAGQLQIVGGTALHLHLTSLMTISTEYYVVWTAGVVEDLVGNPVTAQSSTTIWSFTTTASLAPTWTKKASTIQDSLAPSVSMTLAAAPINNTSTSDVIIVCASSYPAPTGVTIGGNAMTPVIVADNLGIWQHTGVLRTTPDIVLTAGGEMFCGAITVGVLTGVNSTVPTGASIATLADGAHGNPKTTTSALTVPSTGRGIVAYRQLSTAGVSPNAGVTEDYDLTLLAGGTSPYGVWSGYMTSTGTPSVDGLAYIGSSMIAAAWGP